MLTIRSFAGFIFPAIILFLCSSPAMASCVCKERSLPVGECLVNMEVCGCLKKTEWAYSATAEHDESGKTGGSSGDETVDDAESGAISDMFMENPELASKCFPS